LIEWIEADIVDIPSLERAFNGIEYVYHCAAMIHLTPKMKLYCKILGTANIVNFVSAKIKNYATLALQLRLET
jgi:nucleoside-diphosphate-sugar epimerase